MNTLLFKFCKFYSQGVKAKCIAYIILSAGK